MFELSFYQYFTGLSKEDWLYRNQKKDLNILKKEADSQEEKASLIESYSNAGIEILKENLGDSYLSLDNLIDAVEKIDKLIDEKKSQKSDLNSILSGISITIK